MKGPTPLVMFGGIMNASHYAVILENSLLPFIRRNFLTDHRLQQDNDSKHTSKFIQSFFSHHNVNWWKTPPIGKLHQKALTEPSGVSMGIIESIIIYETLTLHQVFLEISHP